MTGTMPTWVSRLAAVGLLAAVIAAAAVFAVMPTLQAYDDTEIALARAKEQVIGFERVARSRSAYEARLEELTVRESASQFYLQGGTDALAAARLQDQVSGVIERHGGTVRSIQSLPGEDDGEFRRVSVRVQFTGTTESLFQAVYSLETARPFVFIDNLDIRNRRSRRRANQQSDNPALSVTLDLSGFVRPRR